MIGDSPQSTDDVSCEANTCLNMGSLTSCLKACSLDVFKISSSHICVSTALSHPSEFRSVFIERNNHDQTPFLGVRCRDVFGQGARSQESECITNKSATGYSSANDIFL